MFHQSVNAHMLHHLIRKRQAEEEEEGDEAKSKKVKEGPEAADPGELLLRKRPRELTQKLLDEGLSRKAVGASLRVRESSLYRPVRAIGLTTDGLPLAHASLGDADFVTASIGRGFQVFDTNRLRLVYIGRRMNEPIRALLCVGEVILTATKNDIIGWHRLLEMGRFRGHTGPATVLCNVGAGLLVSASEEEVLVWQLSDLSAKEPATKLKSAIENAKDAGRVLKPLGKLHVDDSFGTCTAAVHPPTYLHKVLLGGSKGELALWNLRTRECVHRFRSLVSRATTFSTVSLEDESCAITFLCPAPHILDVVAVGFGSGRISILNAREDRILFEFHQAQGCVTSLTFRTGPSAPAHLISGAPNGSFVVWDLDKRRAHHVREDAHRGPVTSARFLADQPLLITNGRDNAIRMWIFDTADGLPRLLRSRCGCPGPAKRIGFYGTEEDREVVVGGDFEGSGFVSRISLIQDQQNLEFSQTNYKKLLFGQRGILQMSTNKMDQMPPVIDLVFCQNRHYDWPALVTIHEKTAAAMVWSAAAMSLTVKTMVPPPEAGPPSAVTAVALSVCGNYCVLGLENGSLHKFNLQSQLYRGPFPKAEERAVDPKKVGESLPQGKIEMHKGRAHRGPICGLHVTVPGQVVSACNHPEDCRLVLWSLADHGEIGSVPLTRGRGGRPSCVKMRVHGSLVAVSLDDGNLLVVDLQGGEIVRSFACERPAVSLAFTPEGRWLAAAMPDAGLRIFDLPASRCIDFFIFAKPALSICFSPSSAYLLTTHAKGNSIQVWANKFLFDPSLSAPLLRPEPSAPVHVDEPGEAEQGELTKEEEKEEEDAGPAKPLVSTIPLAPGLMTLTDAPPAKWLATLHLDLVKERNKAIEAPKPLPNAPFFLPTAHEGVTARFVALEEEESSALERDLSGPGKRPSLSHILQGETSLGAGPGMPFQALLRKGSFDKALDFLRAQTPSGVHLALEQLGPLAGGSLDELRSAMDFFKHHLQRAHFADEVQAFLGIFLQAHGEELSGDASLRRMCAELGQMQEKLWASLGSQCLKARCFLGVLTQTQSQW